jgi:hypothetical protein
MAGCDIERVSESSPARRHHHLHAENVMIHIIALLLHVNITLDLMVREVSRKTMGPPPAWNFLCLGVRRK